VNTPWTVGGCLVNSRFRVRVPGLSGSWVYELLATVERTGARRVVIDSLGDLGFVAGEEARYPGGAASRS
jgi:circadian clock protein KaiC